MLKKNAEEYCDEQKYSEAIFEITHAITINPSESLMLYRDRGNIYLINGQYDKAIADYETAISMVTGDSYILAILYHNRGNAFGLKKMYQDAADNYSIAIDILERIKTVVFVEKYYCKLYSDRADVYEKIGLHDAAARDRAIIENFCKAE